MKASLKLPIPLSGMLIGLILIAPDGLTAGMRCGENLIERGFTFFEVLERCGKPDLEYAWDTRYVPGVEARVTEWVYEQGSNRFRRVLTFEEGRLRNIELRSKPEASLDSVQ